MKCSGMPPCVRMRVESHTTANCRLQATRCVNQCRLMRCCLPSSLYDSPLSHSAPVGLPRVSSLPAPPPRPSRLATRPDVGNRACHSLQHPQPQFNTKPVARTQTQAKAHTCAHRTHPKSTGQVHSRPTDGASGRPRLLPHPSCTPRYRRHATCIVEHLPRLPSKRPLPPLLPPRER